MNENKKTALSCDKFNKRNIEKKEVRSHSLNKSNTLKLKREEILLQYEKLIKKFKWDYKCIINAIYKSQKLYSHFKSKKRDRIKKFIVISHKINRISKILSKKINFFNIRKYRKEKLLKCKKRPRCVNSSISLMKKNDNTRKKIQEQLDLLRNSNKSSERLKSNEKYVENAINPSTINSEIVSNCFETIQNPLINQEDNHAQNLPIVVDVVGNFQEHFLIEDNINKIIDYPFNNSVENNVDVHLNEFDFTNNKNDETILDSTLQNQDADCRLFNEKCTKTLLLPEKVINGHASDESFIKLPTKTLDIKKIKGWRSKNFLSQTQTSDSGLLNVNEIKKENDITFHEEPLSFSDCNIDNINHNNDLNKDENKTEMENKSAFESTFLDQFLSNAKLNISYQVPKLIAEDSISNLVDEHMPSFETNKIVKQNTTTKHFKKSDNSIKVKPKTLAEKRRLLEVNRQKNILHEMELNENTLLKQLRRIPKKQKNENSMNIRKLLLKQNIPITRELWMAAVKCKKIGSLMQKLSFGDDHIYIAGSYVKEENISNSVNKKEIITDINKKDSSLKSENSYSSCIVNPKEIVNSKSQIFKHSTYRPGPLSRKPDLVKEELVNTNVVVRKMPQLFLEVYPEIGKPMHPCAEYYLKLYQENESVISNDWALFAVSMLKHKNTQVTNINNSFIFPVNYSNNQCKILMKEHVVNKPKNICKLDSEPVILNEVKEIMSGILDYLDTPKIDNSVLKYCPDSIDSDKQEHKQRLNQVNVKDDNHTVIRTPKGKIAKSKVMSELKRLSVQFIEVNIDQKKLKVCEKPYCKLGCVCFDSSSEWPKHCGREACMFECLCNSKFEDDLKPHHYVSLPEGVDLLSASTMGQLQNQAKRHLAKEERKFTQTVIKANDQTIVVGEGSRERKKRPTKTPQKYNDYVKVGDDLKLITTTPDSSVKQNIQNSIPIRKSIRIWNKNSKEDLVQQKQEIAKQKCVVFVDKFQGLENILPWCMVHNLYKCFCKGNMLEDALTSVEIKKNSPVKEDENDPNSFIFYSSRRAHQNQNSTSDHRSKLCSRIYGVSSFYITRNKSAYYKTRIAKIRELEEKNSIDQHPILKSVLQTNQDNVEMDSANSVSSTNTKKDMLDNYTEVIDTKSISGRLDNETESLNSPSAKQLFVPASKNWLPDLCLPRPNMQSELRNIFRDFSKRHIFRVMCWIKLSIHFKQNTLYFWYNPSVFGAKLVITKQLNDKPFKFVLLKDFFQNNRRDIPEIVKGLLNDTLPGKATVDKDTYAILVYNGKYWEVRGTVISKNESFAVPENKNNLNNNSDSFLTSNLCENELVINTNIVSSDNQDKDVKITSKEDLEENVNKLSGECNRNSESKSRESHKIQFNPKLKNLDRNNYVMINKETENKSSSDKYKELNKTSEIKNKDCDSNSSVCDGQESNKNSEDQQITKSQYLIRTKKLSELTDVSFETKEVPLTVAKPILSKDILSSKSIQVPLPVSKKDCRWFMLILQDDFVMLRIKGSTTYIRYAKLKKATAVATHFAKTLRVPILRETQSQGDRDPVFGMYAVPGLLERVFFGPYDLDEDHGILKYRYLNGQLVTTKFMEQFYGPHQKSKGIWLYTQAEQKNKLKLQNISLTQSIPYVDLTHEDNTLNNTNTLEANNEIDIFKCSTSASTDNNNMQSTTLPKECNTSSLKKDLRKVNKRKNLGSPKVSDEVFESFSDKSDKSNIKYSESQINENIDNDMPELIEEGKKPYIIKISKEEPTMPVLEPNVSAIKKIEKKTDEEICKKQSQEIDIRSVNSNTILESKTLSTFKNAKIIHNEKTHKHTQNELIDKINISSINSHGLNGSENAYHAQTQLQNVSHNEVSILNDKIEPKLHVIPKKEVITKSSETDVWLISDPPGFGYISLKLIEDEGYVLHSPLSKERKKFGSMKETLNWIDELLRKCLHFVPQNFQIRMYLIKDKKNLRKISALQEDQLQGYHMVSAKGLFDLTTLTENEINSFNLKSREKNKLIMKQKQAITKKLIHELGKTFLSDDIYSYRDEEIVEMACNEIKLTKEKNIKLKMTKRDLAVHHNDLVDKLRTLRYQLRKSQEFDKIKHVTKLNIHGSQKNIESKTSNIYGKNLMKGDKNLISSSSSVNVLPEMSKHVNTSELTAPKFPNLTSKLKTSSTSKTNLKRPYSEISNDDDCIIIESDEENPEEKSENLTLNNVKITVQPKNETKKVANKVATIENKKILLQGGSKFKIVDGKLIYPIAKSTEITINKINNSPEKNKNESEDSCKKIKSSQNHADSKLNCGLVKRVSEKCQSNSLNSTEIETVPSVLLAPAISKPSATLQTMTSKPSLFIPFVLQDGSQVLIPIESKSQLKNDIKGIPATEKNNIPKNNQLSKSKKFIICSKQIPVKLKDKKLNSNSKVIKTSQPVASTLLANNGTSILKSNFPEVIEID